MYKFARIFVYSEGILRTTSTIIIIIMVLFYLSIQYYAVLKEISIR